MLIALDVDGVLIKSQEVFHNIAQSMLGRPLRHVDQWSVWELQENMGLTEDEYRALEQKIDRVHAARNMPAYAGAADLVESLVQDGHSVYFLTAQWKGVYSWVEDRSADLRDKFGDIPVVFTHAKHLCKFDLLLDDKIANVKVAGSRGVLMERPWNSMERDQHTTMHRVKTFEEFKTWHVGQAWRNR
jgi:5'(3')-deoxyribonucleotidase